MTFVLFVACILMASQFAVGQPAGDSAATATSSAAADGVAAVAAVNASDLSTSAPNGTANETATNAPTDTTWAPLPTESEAPKASLVMEPWLIALICLVVVTVFGLSIWAAIRQRQKKQHGKRETERAKAEEAYKIRMDKMSKTIDRL